MLAVNTFKREGIQFNMHGSLLFTVTGTSSLGTLLPVLV
jgi:hypothetical protein